MRNFITNCSIIGALLTAYAQAIALSSYEEEAARAQCSCAQREQGVETMILAQDSEQINFLSVDDNGDGYDDLTNKFITYYWGDNKCAKFSGDIDYLDTHCCC